MFSNFPKTFYLIYEKSAFSTFIWVSWILKIKTSHETIWSRGGLQCTRVSCLYKSLRFLVKCSENRYIWTPLRRFGSRKSNRFIFWEVFWPFKRIVLTSLRQCNPTDPPSVVVIKHYAPFAKKILPFNWCIISYV